MRPTHLHKNQKGFSLIELIVVIGLISLMAAFLIADFGKSSDDAKLGLLNSVILKSTPEAVGRFVAVHGTCNGITATAAATNSNLSDYGMPASTPWQSQIGVTATAAATAAASEYVNVFFPTAGADDVSQAANDMAARLALARTTGSQIQTLICVQTASAACTADVLTLASATGVTVAYPCN